MLLGIIPALPLALLRSPMTSMIFSILRAYAAFYTFLLLSITTYRLSPWHPLYRYPGPFLAKLSNFYGAYIAAGGKQHVHFKRMHERYGPIVRLGTSYFANNWNETSSLQHNRPECIVDCGHRFATVLAQSATRPQ